MSVSAINTYSVTSYKSWPVKAYNNKTKLKEGYVWLNGYKAKIGNTLTETAKNINKLSTKTGVKAQVVKNSKGQERLVLKVLGRVLNINDPKGLLSELYKKGKIGSSKDSIIQVIRRLAGTGNVKINYNTKPFTKERHVFDYLKLSERNIVQLSKIGNVTVNAQINEIVMPCIIPIQEDIQQELSESNSQHIELEEYGSSDYNYNSQHSELEEHESPADNYNSQHIEVEEHESPTDNYEEIPDNIQGLEGSSISSTDSKFTEAKLIINKLKVTIFKLLQDHCESLYLVNSQLMNDIQDTISKLEKLNLDPIQQFSLNLSAYKENLAECSIRSNKIDSKYIALHEDTKAFLEQKKIRILHNFRQEQEELKIKSLSDLNKLIEGVVDEIEIERSQENLQIKNYSASPKQILHNNHTSLNELNEKPASAPPKSSISKYNKLLYLEQKIDKANKSIQDFEVDAHVNLENSDGANLNANDLNFTGDLNFETYEELAQKIEKFEEIRSNNLIGYKNIYTSLKGKVNGKEIPQNSTRELDLTVDAASYKTNSVPLLIDYLSNKEEFLDQYVYIIELIENYENTIDYKLS